MRSMALLFGRRSFPALRPSPSVSAAASASLLLLLRPNFSLTVCARTPTLRPTTRPLAAAATAFAPAGRRCPHRPVRSFAASVLPSPPPPSTMPPPNLPNPPHTPAPSTAAGTLSKFRSVLSARGLDAFVVPSDDCHLSEYVPGAFERRAFLTGFTGSAGTAMVEVSGGSGGARVWTDSRYFVQAAAELDDAEWTLMRQGDAGVPTLPDYLAGRCAERKDYRIGIDPSVHPSSFVRELAAAVSKAGGSVTEIDENPVDAVWPDRPSLPASPFRVHLLEHAGASATEKLRRVSEEMAERGASLAVFAALDEVA
eukprot:CAMPEP_0194269492 /NCGR_PEP_ID=MMETSP0169-20130528/3638_1 /TAXON_ID=218684 /ORGANISM="Corethron pennatum, Strain L29A3" /LENGTH=311 /DNA_ID=CAMNT_0039011155 /DNA_START=14 /DNA_END=946 /DNA_ORIENTATION=-